MADIDKAGAAYRCDFCGDWPNWQMLRVGDAAITWACDEHTAWTLDRFQRDNEQTKVIVTRSMHRAYYEGQQRAARGEGDQPAVVCRVCFQPAHDHPVQIGLVNCPAAYLAPVHSGEGNRPAEGCC